MRPLATILITLLLAVPAMSVELFRYRGAAKAFDGTWSVTLNTHDYKDPNTGQVALAYVYHFSAEIKNGVLHGERGTRGKAGWFELSGERQFYTPTLSLGRRSTISNIKALDRFMHKLAGHMPTT